ncbi:MAG: efflux RND transporter periplasmic adaptor subunit [Acidobacteriia bacterium]|nr:efflux RND transporter periplasmic adaptor subunit [Terriglobia bacterium]
MKNYRTAFFAMLATSMALAATLGLYWWRGSRQPAGPAPMEAGMDMGEQGGGPPAAVTEAKLAPVQIPVERLQRIGVRTAVVQQKMVSNEIRTVGNVEVDERRISYVQLRYPGWIKKVYVDSTYDYIKKGQPLFTIYSPDLVTTEQEYLIAKRNQATLGKSDVPGVATGSNALLEGAVERLRRWEIPARELEKLEKNGKVEQEMEVDSPTTGFVTERNAVPNQYVQPDTRLYTVADFSTVWVYAAVFQSDIGQIKPGNAVVITTDAYTGRKFSGRVDFIWPQVDMATRTVRVRLVIPNPGLLLKPGMFVNVSVSVPLGRHLTIPASGVLQSGTRSIVFVDHGGGSLEPREVELGQQAGSDYVVNKGVKAGERVITAANFLIDSESQLQALMGPLTPAAPAATAGPEKAAQENVQAHFSTDPATPRKGSNLYRVHLTGADGAGVGGAQVSVRSFMPGMPQMGMAAINVESKLEEKGGGVYEGTVQLPSGGTWKITITAVKNGSVLVTTQTSVSAEGGM